MHRLAAIGLLLLAGACNQPGDDVVNNDPVDDGTDAPDCEAGNQVGQCPDDFVLPNADGDDVHLADFASNRVILVGAAEF